MIDPGRTALSGESGPARDSWLTVIGTFRGVGPDGIPELDAAVTQPQEAPVDPYE